MFHGASLCCTSLTSLPGIPLASRASPTTWLLYALVGDQLAGSDAPFSDPTISNSKTVGNFVETDFGYNYGFR